MSDKSSFSAFRRLAWTPDGFMLACPTGLQTPHPNSPPKYAVHLFKREEWSVLAVQCTGLITPPVAPAFYSNLFESQLDSVAKSEIVDYPINSMPYRIIFAVPCRDSVLFYDTENFIRPLSLIVASHRASVNDITWAHDVTCPSSSARRTESSALLPWPKESWGRV